MSLVNTFNEFCGDVNPVDDVTLVCIPCTTKLMCVDNINVSNNMQIASNRDNSWCWYMELGGSSLREVNPVPIAIEEINKIYGCTDSADKLSNIMSVLYENVIRNYDDEYNPPNFDKYNNQDSEIYIRIGIKKVEHNGMPALLVRMEDSGRGLATNKLNSSLNSQDINLANHLDIDLPLIYEFNKKTNSNGTGNSFEAIICEKL
jgi:hypothetical protein